MIALVLVFCSIVIVLVVVVYSYLSWWNLKKLSIISNFTSDLFSTVEIEKLLPLVVNKVVEILNPKRCSIMLLDENNCLRIKIGRNISTYAIRSLKLPLGEGIAGRALEEGKITFVRDVSKSPFYFKLFEVGYKTIKRESLFVIPIKYNEIKYGVLNLHYPVRKKFPATKTEKIIAQLIMEQVSVAVHNCITYQKTVSDAMTKLYNHNYFLKRLEDEIYLSRKYGTKLSLILLDVDYFKKVNDVYGHQAGDMVLVEIARLLKDFTKLTDVVGRYGGEEFGIILPNTSLRAATVIAERLREEIQGRKIFFEDKVISVTCSFGVAEFKVEEVTEKFVYRADKMLYTAKNLGRNRVCSENGSNS